MSGGRPERNRILRFGAVGIANTAVTLAVFGLLTSLGCPGWAASAAAFAAGGANGYYWNSRWTFAERRAQQHRVGARYLAAQGAGTVASALGVAGTHDLLGMTHLSGELVILPLVTALTYALMRSFVFPRPAAEGTPSLA